MRHFFKVFAILVCLSLPVGMFADEQQLRWYATFDFACIDSLWNNHICFRTTIGTEIADSIALELPVSCTFDRSGGDEILLDLSLRLIVHPWAEGFFMGLSLTRACMFLGPHIPQDQIIYMNEFTMGYTWEFKPGWFIRPSVIYRDPSDTDIENFIYIEGLVPSHTRVCVCVELGWLFATIAPDREA